MSFFPHIKLRRGFLVGICPIFSPCRAPKSNRQVAQKEARHSSGSLQAPVLLAHRKDAFSDGRDLFWMGKDVTK